MKKKHISLDNTDHNIPNLNDSTNSSSNPLDTSKNRAERHLRREQRRIESGLSHFYYPKNGRNNSGIFCYDDEYNNEDDDEEEEDEDEDEEKEEDDDYSETNNKDGEDYQIKSGGGHSKTNFIRVRKLGHISSTSNLKSSFSVKLDAVGKPKIPISRSHLPILNPLKIRRSALLEPSKTVAILPKPSFSSSIFRPNNFSTQSSPKSYQLPTYSLNSSASSKFINGLTNSSTNFKNISSMGASTSTKNQSLSVKTTTKTTPNVSAARKIYRVYDTLFTEDAKPVRIGPDGKLFPIDPNSVGSDLKRLAIQMIARYHQSQPKLDKTINDRTKVTNDDDLASTTTN